MGTSTVTPCYDVERLQTKTHVGSVGETSFIAIIVNLISQISFKLK